MFQDSCVFVFMRDGNGYNIYPDKDSTGDILRKLSLGGTVSSGQGASRIEFQASEMLISYVIPDLSEVPLGTVIKISYDNGGAVNWCISKGNADKVAKAIHDGYAGLLLLDDGQDCLLNLGGIRAVAMYDRERIPSADEVRLQAEFSDGSIEVNVGMSEAERARSFMMSNRGLPYLGVNTDGYPYKIIVDDACRINITQPA